MLSYQFKIIIPLENGAYDFTEKLEIWTPIIKGLITHNKLNRYNDVIDKLMFEIMHRIQFEYNKTELELLDNELMEDNVSIFVTFFPLLFFTMQLLFNNYML